MSAANAKLPRAQRALALPNGKGFANISVAVDWEAKDTPVFVIPEAALKGCKHYDIRMGEAGTECWCVDCGAYRDLRFSDYSRWQRPRLLRVGRAGK